MMMKVNVWARISVIVALMWSTFVFVQHYSDGDRLRSLVQSTTVEGVLNNIQAYQEHLTKNLSAALTSSSTAFLDENSTLKSSQGNNTEVETNSIYEQEKGAQHPRTESTDQKDSSKSNSKEEPGAPPAPELPVFDRTLVARVKVTENSWNIERFKQTQAAGLSAKRIALFHGVGGYANTMYSFLTGVLYAAITNRAFFFSSPYNALLQADKTGWDASLLSDELKALAQANNHDMVDWCYSVGSDMSQHWARASNAEPLPTDSVQVVSNCPLFKFLAQNPHARQRMIELGLADPAQEAALPFYFQAVHHIARTLMLPGPEISAILDRARRDLRGDAGPGGESFDPSAASSASLTIGMQIRMGGPPHDSVIFGPDDRNWHGRYFACADSIAAAAAGGAPGITVAGPPATEMIPDPPPPPPPAKPTFYVTSDHTHVHVAAEGYYRERGARVLYDQAASLHSAHVGEDDGRTRAVAENFVLSLCDYLVITPASTFGALAAILGGTQPHYVTTNEGGDQWKCHVTDLRNAPSRYHLPDSAAL